MRTGADSENAGEEEDNNGRDAAGNRLRPSARPAYGGGTRFAGEVAAPIATVGRFGAV